MRSLHILVHDLSLVFAGLDVDETNEQGDFVVLKPGTHPMRTKLQLYFKWGIKFEEPYQTPERAQREVYYAGKEELLMNIKKSLYSQPQPVTASKPDGYMSSYGDK